MATIRRPRCPVCGAQLRRNRQPGLCGPCERVGPDPRANLPADFYTRPDVVAWLRGYDFGPFFREVRRLTGWSQHTLGGVTGLAQAAISGIERGEHRLRDIELIAGVADALQIPPALLNLPSIRATVGEQGNTEQTEVSWVDRRDFGQHVAATVLGIATASQLDIGRLLALLPQAEPTGTRHIGIGDVEFIEQLTIAFRRQDFAQGSGPIRSAVIAQLDAVLPLLNAQVAPEVRPRLLLATADMALQAAWVSFDQHHHDAARRLWMIGLDLARRAEHPRATDLTVHLLVNMANQAEHLRRPKETVHLVRIGHAAADDRRYPVSVAESICLNLTLASAHAVQADTPACDRALGQAVDQFSTIDPTGAAPWATNINGAFFASRQGHAWYELALATQDPTIAAKAAPMLSQALDHFGPDYARSTALYRPELAAAYALSGDPDTAVATGHQAVDAVTAVSSLRARDRLRTLHTVLEPLQASTGVAELRDRLTTTTAA